MQSELLALLAAQTGHYRYESGHHGNLWLDLDLLFQRPKQLQRFMVELAARLQKYQARAVCGPLVGGALTAQAIAIELDIEFYYTERSIPSDHATLYPITYSLPGSIGKRLHDKDVLVIDDVINAGSAVRGTVAALKLYGARPVAVGALLVLGSDAPNFFADQDIPIESIAQLPSHLWTPNDCPLCASNVPLEELA
jgi:orotate phosphoribosyltransferase